ncbi:MAG: ABC transporter ATP-binding protein [Actinomycetia bacterium]|nr:ABC transporter ATP-binding protein [Actinomycetes bacterium]
MRSTQGETILEVNDLVVSYEGHHRSAQGGRRRVVALDGVSLRLEAGKCLAVVGESGSGKSTLARAIVGLTKPDSGQIRYRSEDLGSASAKRRRDLRRHIQMVFQDPYGSINRRLTVRSVVAEPLENYYPNWSSTELDARVADLLSKVRMPTDAVTRKASALSGGQLQRVGIARALALDPQLIVADEPVSALDASVQASILNLLSELKVQYAMSFLFITHDLAVAQHVADEIAVIYKGKIVERGEARSVVRNPQDPYTQRLINAIPGFRSRPSRPIPGD